MWRKQRVLMMGTCSDSLETVLNRRPIDIDPFIRAKVPLGTPSPSAHHTVMQMEEHPFEVCSVVASMYVVTRVVRVPDNDIDSDVHGKQSIEQMVEQLQSAKAFTPTLQLLPLELGY